MGKCVAVITRTKNRTMLLKRAVESVLDQTYANWVHVIVNDGGKQEPVDELLTTYAQRYNGRLQVIHNPESLGMEAASNKGINASQSEYVVIHDDDDSWEPRFLDACVCALEGCEIPSVKGVATHINQIFERVDNNETTHEISRRDFDPHLTSVSLPEISEINKFMPISFLFRKEVFDVIGMYDEELPVVGDWEFNIRFLSKFDLVVVKEKLANYYIRVDSHEDYANTVTAGQDDHQFYRALIVNKHLRNELETGKITIGMLMTLGDYFHRVSGNTWRMIQFIERLKNLAPLKILRRLLHV